MQGAIKPAPSTFHTWLFGFTVSLLYAFHPPLAAPGLTDLPLLAERGDTSGCCCCCCGMRLCPGDGLRMRIGLALGILDSRLAMDGDGAACSFCALTSETLPASKRFASN